MRVAVDAKRGAWALAVVMLVGCGGNESAGSATSAATTGASSSSGAGTGGNGSGGGTAGGPVAMPCAHEPPGYALVNEQPWDQAPIYQKQEPEGWIDDTNEGATAFQIVDDPTSPYPWKDHHVIRALFPEGFPGGSSPFFVYRPFSQAEQYENLYVCFDLLHDADFDNTNGNAGTKLLWFATQFAQNTTVYTGHDGADAAYDLFLQGTPGGNIDGVGGNVDANAMRIQPLFGTWVRYEVLLEMNTAGNSDGVYKAWINGKLVSDVNDLWFVEAGDPHVWFSVAWNPTYGGGLNPVPHDQHQTMDHLRILGAHP